MKEQQQQRQERILVGMVGWLGGWSVGWVVGWLVGWVVGWVVGWLVAERSNNMLVYHRN